MVNRDTLKNFLSKKGCKTTNRVMEMLEPFFQIAENGIFKLAPEEKIDENKLKEAISAATKTPISKIVFVSISNPFPQPEWMTEEVYKNILWNSLRNSFKVNLGDILKVSFKVNLGDILGDILKVKLGISLKINLGDNLWNNLRDSLRDSLWNSLLFFIDFSLINNKELTSRLEPLLKFWEKCFILGEKKDEPGTWLILVK